MIFSENVKGRPSALRTVCVAANRHTHPTNHSSTQPSENTSQSTLCLHTSLRSGVRCHAAVLWAEGALSQQARGEKKKRERQPDESTRHAHAPRRCGSSWSTPPPALGSLEGLEQTAACRQTTWRAPAWTARAELVERATLKCGREQTRAAAFAKGRTSATATMTIQGKVSSSLLLHITIGGSKDDGSEQGRFVH